MRSLTLTGRFVASVILTLWCGPSATAADRTVDCDAVVQSRKRGLAMEGSDYPAGMKLTQADFNILSPGVSWYYNWGPSTTVNDALGRMAFVPMAWGSGSPGNVRAWLKAHPETMVVLSANEPNLTSEANLSPDAAAMLIKNTRAIAGNRSVFGPHLAAGTNYPGYTSTTAYRNAIYAALGGNMPATGIHIYESTTGGFSYWVSLWPHREWPAGTKPPSKVWVKEFNIGDIVTSQGPPRVTRKATEAEVIDYMIYAVDLMERDVRVERYAWWKDRRITDATHTRPTSHFILNQTVNGKLTNLGTLYVNMPVHDPTLYYRLPARGTGRLQVERYVDISGFALPDTINGNVSVGYSEDASGAFDIDDIDGDEWIDLNIDAPVAGAYEVAVRGKRAASGTTTLSVLQGGTVQGSVILTAGTTYATSATAPVTLIQGRQTIRLQVVGSASNNTSLNWIEFTTRPPTQGGSN